MQPTFPASHRLQRATSVSCQFAKARFSDLRAIGLTPDNIESMAIGKAKDGTDVLILARITISGFAEKPVLRLPGSSVHPVKRHV